MGENKMGVMPVGKLLFTMSIPMVLSMLVQALYNVVDSIFVAMINEEALTAVSLAFPIQNLMISLGVGTGVGVNALCSRYLGAKRPEKANSVATHGIRLAIITTICFMIFVFFFTKPFFASLTEDELIYEYGVTYTRIVGCICAGILFQTILEKILTSTGRTLFSMIAQLAGAITNIILDPILIFGLLGLPRLGVAGAAIATVIGQFVGASTALFLVLNKNPEIKISFKDNPFSISVVKDIYKIAVPSIILASVGSIMNFGLNKILLWFSSTAAAVFGVYFKLQSFIFMPIFGLNNGLVPIVAYNYGAAKVDRIKSAMKYAYMAAISIMFCGMLAFLFIPDVLLTMFSASNNMLEVGVPALRIISIHFCIAGFCIITGSMFQALGRAVFSMMTSILRQLAALLPAAFVLAKIGGLGMVWWAFPIAEVVSLIVTLIFLSKIRREVLIPMENRQSSIVS